MARFCFIFFFLINCSLWCKGQKPVNEHGFTDSLETVLRQTNSDSIRARTNFALSEFWAAKDSIKAWKYLNKGRQFSEKNSYLRALYYYYNARLLVQTNWDKSEKIYMKADTLLNSFQTKDAYLFKAKVWYEYGTVRQRKDDYKAFANILLNKVIPLALKANNNVYVGKAYLALGIVFKNAGQFDKAEVYCLKGIQILKSTQASSGELISAYHTIAENYILSGKSPKARAALDSASRLLTEYPNSVYLLNHYAAEGMYFTVSSQFKKALESLDKGVALAKKLGLRYEEQRLQLQRFYALYNDKSYAAAKSVLIYLMKQREMMKMATNRLQLYYGMAVADQGMKDMTGAFDWLKRYSELSDSVSQSKFKDDINAMEIKYRNAENQKKIAILETEEQKATLSAKNSRLNILLLGTASICLLIVAAASIFYYRSNKKLFMQKEINHHQQLKDLEQQQKLTVTKAILTGEEKERTRVARDLHDGLGGMLAGVKINLSGWMASHDAKKQDAELHQIIGQLDHSVSELRHIARNMMPETLLQFGLETALKDLCESLMTKDIHIDFQTFGIEKNLSISAQIAIYRIIQEIMANAIRHAQATSIVLQCSQNNTVFFITAEDNGVGFDTGTSNKMTGMGLNNIKNRVDYLNGKLDITSVINEGTTINIELNVA